MNYSIQDSPSQAKLYLAFELGNQAWKPGFSVGLGQSSRRRTIWAGDKVGIHRKKFMGQMPLSAIGSNSWWSEVTNSALTLFVRANAKQSAKDTFSVTLYILYWKASEFQPSLFA